MRRTERLVQLTKRLAERPGTLQSVSDLSLELDAAKSSISEDIAMIRDVFLAAGEGTIQTVAGAAGGVSYIPAVPEQTRLLFLQALCDRLQDSTRILPGGFLYMSDVLGDPDVLDMVGRLFAAHYAAAGVDIVVTVETKGIPIAVTTGRYLHVPVVVVRRDHRVTEGAAVTMHYVSGSNRRIQTMAVSKRAMPMHARVLIVDDFMRAGATIKAVTSLLSEFDANVVGTAVLMATAVPEEKLVSDYLALFTLGDLVEGGAVELTFANPLA